MQHSSRLVEGGGAGALAEAEQQQIGTQRVHVPAFQRVVVALLLRAVVQNAGVLEAGVIAEQRLDEQLLRPADAVAHRADNGVLADHNAHVAREEQVGERGEGVAGLVQGAGDRPCLFQRALDHAADEGLGRQGRELLGERVGRHHLERPGHQELAHVGAGHQLGEERAHFVDLGEALQHGDKAPMLALRELQVDDVVVQVVFPAAGRDSHQLAPGGVDQDGPQRTDFRGDVDAGHGQNLTRNAEGGAEVGTRNAEQQGKVARLAALAVIVPRSAFRLPRFSGSPARSSGSRARAPCSPTSRPHRPGR